MVGTIIFVYLLKRNNMIREEYIKIQAVELLKATKKIKRINESLQNDNTYNRIQKLHAELSWACMEKGQTEERLRFALGDLLIDSVRDFWEPSGWHKYNGIRKELEMLKFD